MASFDGDASGCSFFELNDGKIYNIMYSFYGGGGTVSRTSSPLGSVTDVMEPGVPRAVMTRVKAFDLLYLGPQQMTGEKLPVDTWNSSSMGLPRVVRIAVELENGERYERMVTLPITV
jgi:hypothetical protein